MPIFVIAIVVVVIVIVAALFLANGTARIDGAVQKNKEAIDKGGVKYNLALTQGYEIAVNADVETQLHEARILAAKQAAALPRGANMGIGRMGQADELRTAWKGVENDPVTAVKIAAYHGWEGVKTGVVIAEPAAVVPAAMAPVAGGKIKLIPGKDYPVVEITDDMDPAEKRKARVANAKAKSAAMKAAKAAAGSGTAPVATPVATAVAIPEPELIEITDDMPPDEKRKARIANSKAKSAYKKALKAAGVDSKIAALPTSVAASESISATPAPEAAAASIPPPELIELTDTMSPEDKRAARIANSKAKSAYKKALKAAGFDPKAVTTTAAPATATDAAPTPPSIAPDAAAANVPLPELIELTDDMAPEDKRAARIANSKAKSAYKKALKAAGIDPKTVKV